jgi:cytochrome c553
MKRKRILTSTGIFSLGFIFLISLRAAGPAGIAVRPEAASSPTVSQAPAVPPSLDDYLVWDSVAKEETVSNGTAFANFAFTFTNVSSEPVVITSALGSCGCTVAELPETPWTNAPGAVGKFNVKMNLAGKFGTVFKTVTVGTENHGTKVLMVKTIIAPPQRTTAMVEADRNQNRMMAVSDRQAVFKNDCARCHVEPARDKMGQPLYAAACGICHEDEHRATMVPDLHAIPQETNAEFWRNWITYGKPGTLMPAFAKSEGGILTDAQIASLVSYLSATIPSHAATRSASK